MDSSVNLYSAQNVTILKLTWYVTFFAVASDAFNVRTIRTGDDEAGFFSAVSVCVCLSVYAVTDKLWIRN